MEVGADETVELRLFFRRIHLPFQQGNCYQESMDWIVESWGGISVWGLLGAELGL